MCDFGFPTRNIEDLDHILHPVLAVGQMCGVRENGVMLMDHFYGLLAVIIEVVFHHLGGN
jgi:cobalamin biosynthesis protein CobD/CbiB